MSHFADLTYVFYDTSNADCLLDILIGTVGQVGPSGFTLTDVSVYGSHNWKREI